MSRIEDEVCKKIQERAGVGLDKYGTTMERKDFSTLDWLIYAQEEALDFCVYLQRLIEDEEKRLEDEAFKEMIFNKVKIALEEEKEYNVSGLNVNRWKGRIEALEFVLEQMQEEEE